MTDLSSDAPMHGHVPPPGVGAWPPPPEARIVNRRATVTWPLGQARQCIGAAAVVGIAADQAVATDPIGLAGSVAALAAIVALTTVTRLRGAARMWAALGLAVTPWLSVRASPWLVIPDIVAIGALLALSAAPGGLPQTFFRSLANVAGIVRASLGVPKELPGLLRAGRRSGVSDNRVGSRWGFALAIPLVTVVVALLASADAVFRSLFNGLHLSTSLRHGVVIGFGALAWFALVIRTRRAAPERVAGRLLIGEREAGVIIAALSAVLGLYVASTVAAAAAGQAYVERRSGLTYAQYARSGFFQLIAVVLIVVAVLVTLRPVIDLAVHRRTTFGLSLVMAALTMAVVAVSIARLQTYRSVYGLTMLRLSTTVFAGWLGLVLIMVAVTMVRNSWRPALVSAVIVSSIMALVGMNWVNPEAMVARENLERLNVVNDVGDLASWRAAFDDVYVSELLGDDAVPAIVSRLGLLPEVQRATVVNVLCRRGQANHGWSWNFSRWKAKDRLKSLC